MRASPSCCLVVLRYFFFGAAFFTAAFFVAGFLVAAFFDVVAMVAILPFPAALHCSYRKI